MIELLSKLYYLNGVLYWAETVHNRAQQDMVAGTIKSTGYCEIQYKRKRYYAHRLIYTLFYGEIKDGYIIDHMDRNPSNNDHTNLRLLTQTNNLHNIKHRKTNKLGVRGIYQKTSGLFEASLSYKGIRIFRHTYLTLEEAKQQLELFREGYFNAK